MNFVRAELIVGNQVSIMLGTNWTQTRDIGNIASLSVFFRPLYTCSVQIFPSTVLVLRY